VESDTVVIDLVCQGFASGASSTNIDCFGNQNGMIDLTVVGGTPGYTYSWSTGDTTQDISNLSAGIYTVSLTDQNGCNRQQTVTINEPSALTATIQGSDAVCHGTPSGIINLNPSGGTSSYTYSWSNGDSTQNLLNIPIGIYTVSVTDANNCSIQLSDTISQPNPIVLHTTPSATLCFGEASGSINLGVSGGSSGYTYSWSNGDTTQNISNLLAGTYSVLVTDVNNCAMQISDTVGNASPIGISLSNTNATCPNIDDATIDLTVVGGTPPYQYSWSNGASTQDLSGLGAGIYIFVLADSNACNRTDSIIVTAPPAPSFSLSAQDLLCAGDSSGSINLTINGGSAPFTYTWSNGDTTANLALLPAGTFSLSLTDDLGCVFGDSTTLAEPSQLVVDNLISTPDSTGSSGTASISVSGGTPPYSFVWSNGATDSTLTGLAAGDYSVIISDANACSLEDSATVMLLNVIAIESPLGLQSAQVYPNPVQDVINLDLAWQTAQQPRLRLYNLHGQLIREQKLPLQQIHNEQLELHDLSVGIYLLEISTESGLWTQRIQKL
ncbi:MAG: T9SS type A sorting domain-containing protein, partial [Bacteroidia bacterium]